MFLYALRREVLRNILKAWLDADYQEQFLYALRREVLRNVRDKRIVVQGSCRFLYALRREVLRNSWTSSAPPVRCKCFYTPFGVRCFGTGTRCERWRPPCSRFLYALRREVLRNLRRGSDMQKPFLKFLYALRREVLRNPTWR